jgi:hypothetical protein
MRMPARLVGGGASASAIPVPRQEIVLITVDTLAATSVGSGA